MSEKAIYHLLFISVLTRGCYQGEWKVDPEKIGCHSQAGAMYCFCEGDLCNNKDPQPQVQYKTKQHSTYKSKRKRHWKHMT